MDIDASPTRIGELFENPVTGERGVVRVAPRQSNGHLLVVDLYVRPGGAVAGEHVHPALTETFTVVRGQLKVRHDGRELAAGQGTRTRVTPGVAHDFWNAGTEEARVLVDLEPLPAEIAGRIPSLPADPTQPAGGRSRWPNSTSISAGR